MPNAREKSVRAEGLGQKRLRSLVARFREVKTSVGAEGMGRKIRVRSSEEPKEKSGGAEGIEQGRSRSMAARGTHSVEVGEDGERARPPTAPRRPLPRP